MRWRNWTRIAATALFLIQPGWSVASETGPMVHLKAGEMPMEEFMAMVSDTLDIEIDLSSVGPTKTPLSVPEVGLISPERARALVLTTLYLEGFTWIRGAPNDLHRIYRLRDARDKEIPMLTDADPLPDSDLLITSILAIRNTPPEYIARNLRSFMPANSRIIPDEATGSVMITDSAHNIAKHKELVHRLDTPEAGRKLKEWIRGRELKAESDCPRSPWEAPGPRPGVLIALFSLIAMVIGFLMRGYVIRRIEGGL